MSADDRTRLHNLQQETQLGPFFDTYNGTVLITGFNEVQTRIENFEVRDDDVWVTSFPKSGTTWTQEMVWLLANNLDYEAASVSLEERYSFLEGGGLTSALTKLIPILSFPDPLEILEQESGRRFIKTHLPWNLLPLQIRNGSKKPKIIHVLRNSRDVCISFYHQTKVFPMLYESMQDYFNQFISDKFLYSPYWNGVLSYWDRRDQDNVFILKFEDMINDLPTEIKRTADFLDVSPSDEDIASLADHLSFERMKKNKAVNFEQITNIMKTMGFIAEQSLMRKGKIGSHKEELNEDMINLLDTWCELNSKDSGLEFKS